MFGVGLLNLKPVLIPSLFCLPGYIKVHSQCGSLREVGFRSPKLEGWRQAWGAQYGGGHAADIEVLIYSIIQQLTSHNSLAIQSNPLIAQTRLAHPPALPSVPRSLSKNSTTDEFAFAQGRNNPNCFLQHIFHVHYRNFIPFYSKSFDWAGPAHLADLPVLTHQVAFANVHPNVWRSPCPLLSV